MSKASKIEFLDFAKGYAIFSVVLYHACMQVGLSPVFQQAIVFGGTGVHLFFLLSGFGLGLSKTSAGAADFYRRRMSKVWLPYVLVLTISLLAAVVLDFFPDRLDAWAAGVLLYQMFVERYIESFGGHFWFISAIMQFYLVFPGLLFVKKRLGNPWVFFACSLFVSVAWWAVVFFAGKGGERVWSSCFLQFLWEFALGMALADVFKSRENRALPLKFSLSVPPKPPVGALLRGDFWNYRWWVYLPVGLVFTAVMVFMILKMGEVGKIFNDVPALVGYTSLCVFAYHFGEKFLPPLKRFFGWIGGFSFSLYLVHMLVLQIFLGFLRLQNWPLGWPMLAVYLGLALAAGWAFEPVSRWWTGLFEPGKLGNLAPEKPRG